MKGISSSPSSVTFILFPSRRIVVYIVLQVLQVEPLGRILSTMTNRRLRSEPFPSFELSNFRNVLQEGHDISAGGIDNVEDSLPKFWKRREGATKRWFVKFTDTVLLRPRGGGERYSGRTRANGR